MKWDNMSHLVPNKVDLYVKTAVKGESIKQWPYTMGGTLHTKSICLGVEHSSRDVYFLQYPTWIRTQSFPKEKRFRTVGSWSRRVPGERPLMIRTQLGYERVTNFGFVAGGNRNNFLAQVTLQLDF